MTKIDKAVAFVRAMGNELEQLRLRVMIHEPIDVREALQLISDNQCLDGGWKPFWSDTSALDSTCFRLAQLEQLGASGSEHVVKRALEFISDRQSDNGGWEEDASLADVAPPWSKPGVIGAELYLTANCAYWVALFLGAKRSVHAAAAFLRNHVDSIGSMPSFLQTHWLTAAILLTTGATSEAELILSRLHVRMVDMDAGDLAWMINSLLGVGLEIRHPLVQQAQNLLLSKQESDGRFRSADGPDQDVHMTLEALRAIGRGVLHGKIR